MKIVSHTVDHHGPPDHICHPESVCGYPLTGTAATQHQRGEISCVSRVREACGVVMTAGAGKGSPRAGITLVNVKTKEPGAACRQTLDVGCYHYEIPLLIEFYLPAKAGVFSSDMGDGIGPY